MAKIYKLKKKNPIIGLVILAAVLFCLSASVMPFLADKKAFSSPELLLCLSCLLPFALDVKKAAIFGAILGFLQDLFISEPVAFSPVIYLCGIFIASFLYGYFAEVRPVSAAICTLPALFLRGLCDTLVTLARFKNTDVFEVLITNIAPALAVNLAAAIVISFVVYALR